MGTFLLNLNPVQVLHAFEAIHHFNLNDKDCLILFKSRLGKTEELRKNKTLDLLSKRPEIEWVVVESDGSLIGKFKQFINLSNLIKQHYAKSKSKSNYKLYVGNYFTSVFRAVSNKVSIDTVVLDEGTTTLVVDVYRKKPIRVLTKLKVICGYDERFKNRLTFFTAMGKPNKSDVWLDNTYEYFKSKLVTTAASDEVWIIGTPLVELGYTSSKYYKNLIRAAVNPYLNKYTLKYFLHGAENKNAKENLLGSDIETVKLNYPIELYLLESQSIPHLIISPFSSVNFYLAKILPNINSLIMPEIDQMEISPSFLDKFLVIKQEQNKLMTL